MPESKWHPNMIVIAPLLSTLYDTLEKHCGGLAHVVIDDHNYDDLSIDYVINYCNEPENKNRLDRYLVLCLMDYLREMTKEQRDLCMQFLKDTVFDSDLGLYLDYSYVTQEAFDKWYSNFTINTQEDQWEDSMLYDNGFGHICKSEGYW